MARAMRPYDFLPPASFSAAATLATQVNFASEMAWQACKNSFMRDN
jgi:hypothetical protein